MRRILILYIATNSGHHTAARAVEEAMHRQNPGIQTLCVDLPAHSHPRWNVVVTRTYMGIIRRTPEVWDALYDSRGLDAMTRRIRRLVQLGDNPRFLQLMERFVPEAVVCTQAYPFAVVGAYVRRLNIDLPIWGVLTDYRPHRFWVNDFGGHYIAPTASAAERLTRFGVPAHRIRILGIPISPAFADTPPATRPIGPLPHVLITGGSRGLGPGPGTLRALDRSKSPFRMTVLTGLNQALHRQLTDKRQSFNHALRIVSFTRNMASFMRRTSLLIGKPGGLTCAEAMAMGLPMLLVRPLPGQERGNADELVRQGAAISLRSDRELPGMTDLLVGHPELLCLMSAQARAMGRPCAAMDIAREVMNLS